jgi:hypothetical protein
LVALVEWAVEWVVVGLRTWAASVEWAVVALRPWAALVECAVVLGALAGSADSVVGLLAAPPFSGDRRSSIVGSFQDTDSPSFRTADSPSFRTAGS